MTFTLLGALKASLQSADPVHELDHWLSTYSGDFAFTAEELNACWKYLSEFFMDGSAQDLWVMLGEIMYREKALRSLWKQERQFWRSLIEYEEDEILQKTMLADYLAKKPANYVKECRRRLRTTTNEIALMMGTFMNPPEEPWISFNERCGTVRIKILRALDAAEDFLKGAA
jgi:hypothetical protein